MPAESRQILQGGQVPERPLHIQAARQRHRQRRE